MLDIKTIRENLGEVKRAMLNRNQNVDLNKLLELDNEKKTKIKEIEQLRSKRNKESKEIGRLKSSGKKYFSTPFEGVNQIRIKIQGYEKQLLIIEKQIKDLLLFVPNIPDKKVPIGKEEKDSKIIKFVGKPKNFSFKPKQHLEIGENLGILDFATASKISGSRFVILKDKGCALERALISFFIDAHTKKGYKEIMTPYLVNRYSMEGTGQLPRFEEEVFKCTEDNLYLIPTAEVSVTNIYRNNILDASELPQKYVSYSACFRREAGTYGKEAKGLIRNHQFNKVELVEFVEAKTSDKELESLVLDVGHILELLGLPYRIVLLNTRDLGFSSAMTYDLEAWFAGDSTYKEISSCSNFKDFQARRMNIRVKSKKNEFLHTLNGSGVAVGRAFSAILEYYQQEDGSVIMPEVLRKYTKFDIIKK
jgi:seryl-tRNA synthetase